jgi:hypothetical protein
MYSIKRSYLIIVSQLLGITIMIPHFTKQFPKQMMIFSNEFMSDISAKKCNFRTVPFAFLRSECP